ncbi:hypothetical protein L3476_22200 [Paenibacillus thiaminolyticus]|uniref:hypothetical protein n=1 Tax=Paenibacillus thiaminolyticus TaxID=49283 RepID=UPI002350449A|nr:hypothetical protein [Paenibacillus thiaminolyticus]WCR25976.1 hypothetical protein L3476_22200 [Paenibacillus thiaminolyticus]
MLLVPARPVTACGWANPFEPHQQQLTHPVRRSTMAGEASAPPAGGGAIFEDSGWNYL